MKLSPEISDVLLRKSGSCKAVKAPQRLYLNRLYHQSS